MHMKLRRGNSINNKKIKEEKKWRWGQKDWRKQGMAWITGQVIRAVLSGGSIPPWRSPASTFWRSVDLDAQEQWRWLAENLSLKTLGRTGAWRPTKTCPVRSLRSTHPVKLRFTEPPFSFSTAPRLESKLSTPCWALAFSPAKLHRDAVGMKSHCKVLCFRVSPQK